MGRFAAGIPPKSSADWGWAQHMQAALNETGRAAMVLDTGAVSRGSGSKCLEPRARRPPGAGGGRRIEGVVLLPENLFYNTTAPGILLLLNRAKPADRRGQFLLINASTYFVKEKPKNVLSDAGIAAVAEAYRAWETREKLRRVVTLDEVRQPTTTSRPSQFVEVNDRVQHRPLAENSWLTWRPPRRARARGRRVGGGAGAAGPLIPPRRFAPPNRKGPMRVPRVSLHRCRPSQLYHCPVE